MPAEIPRFRRGARIACRALSFLLVAAAAAAPFTQYIGQGTMYFENVAVYGLVLALGAALYQAPGWLAWARGSRQETAVWLTTWLAGWTLVGWAVALFLALRELPPPGPRDVPDAPLARRV